MANIIIPILVLDCLGKILFFFACSVGSNFQVGKLLTAVQQGTRGDELERRAQKRPDFGTQEH